VIKPGRILFEIAGVREDAAREAMRLASFKLPIPTKFVTRIETAAPEGTAEDTEEAANG
jgi:large subunit ribosomal protein L16